MERNLLLREINDISSRRDFFWRQPVMPAITYGSPFSFDDKAKMVKKIQADSLTELAIWAGKRETDAGMYDVVKKYWMNGVGLSAKAASTIIAERKADVQNGVNEVRHPWSAAFVSYIMRKAYPSFLPSTAHNRYIQWAKNNRNTNVHPFQAFRVSEVSVESGDIICSARDKKNWASYDNVDGKFTHGDIVTRIQNGFAVTIGGNVNRNVQEKTASYKLDADGMLIQEYVTINKKSLPKFIAIIKLMPYYQKGYVVSDDFEFEALEDGNFYGFLGEKCFLRTDDLKTIQKYQGYSLYFPKDALVDLLAEKKSGTETWVKVQAQANYDVTYSNGVTVTLFYQEGNSVPNMTGWIKKAWIKTIRQSGTPSSDTPVLDVSTPSSSLSINCGTAEWEAIKGDFKTQTWDLSYIGSKAAKESDSAYQSRKEAAILFKEKIYAVARKAGQNPDTWFKNFTQVTFLGRSFNYPIHTELATHLKVVEDDLLRKYALKSKDAKGLGDMLGLTNETFKGGRRVSETADVSMHTFGLAMDVNYQQNPYLGGNVSSRDTLLSLEKAGYIKIGSKSSFAKLDILDKIFNRMGYLFNGDANGVIVRYPRNHTFDTRLDLYDKLLALSKLTIKYFNIIDNTSELDALLKKEQSAAWSGVSVSEAIEIINIDFDWFRGLVSRYGEKGTDLTIKKSGFLNLDRRFVAELGLDWGATYGDIMHFDMRNRCLGKKIDQSR